MKLENDENIYLNSKELENSRVIIGKIQSPLKKYINAPDYKPWFSIILPTFNRSYIICNAIEALRRQTYKNFEIIIIDDGSTDDSEQLIKSRYADMLSDNILRYIKVKNGGVCKARNIGLRNAKYEWIAYVDSDNIVSDDFLESYVQAIYDNPNAEAFNAKLIRIGDKGIVGQEYDRDSLLLANYIDIGTYVHKKSLVKELGDFDEHMTRLVDWELIVRLSEKYPPVFIDRVVLFYNDGEDPSRITHGISLYYNMNYFKKKHCNYPLITTVILSYNQEKYIGYAIESAMMQWGPFVHEILVSDDASSDGTREIVKKYAYQYPDMITDISNDTNIGISENYRKCFATANGDYIAILEGDDYWVDKEKNAKQMSFLRDNVDCSMVFSGLKTLKDGNFSEINIRKGLPSKLTGQDLLDRDEGLIINFSCVMYRKKLLAHLPNVLYQYRISELALAFYFDTLGKIGFIKDIGTIYRIREDGVWSGASIKEKLIQKREVRKVALAVCSDCNKEKFTSILRNLNKQIELTSVNEKYEHLERLWKIKHSEYFDDDWYRKTYELPRNVDSAEHYISSNGFEFDPSPQFSGKEYFSLYYDAYKNGYNPLVHYEECEKENPVSWDAAIEKYFPDEKLPGLTEERNPFFSVIVASYNYEDLVIETLKSLVNQTYKNFEIIIVDDGSPDHSLEKIKKFVKNYYSSQPSIKVATHPNHVNRGLAATLKLALKYCTGAYVAFCECDDLWKPHHLEELAKIVKKSKYHARIITNDVEIFGNVERFPYADGLRNLRLKKINQAINCITPEEFRVRNWILTFSCTCVRKDILARCDFNVKGTPETIDWWLWRQICYDTPLFFINQQLTCWRMHASYMTRKKDDQALQLHRLHKFLEESDKILKKQHPDCPPSWMIKNTVKKNGKSSTESSYNRELKSNDELQREINKLQFDFDSMQNSVSFRIGRIITWLPRKLRGGMWCLRDHGIGYTVRRTIEHFGVNMGTGDFKR